MTCAKIVWRRRIKRTSTKYSTKSTRILSTCTGPVTIVKATQSGARDLSAKYALNTICARVQFVILKIALTKT